jgi:hypothetical protein
MKIIKKIIFVLVMLFFILCFCEGICRSFFYFLKKEGHVSALTELPSFWPSSSFFPRRTLIHPYLGYVYKTTDHAQPPYFWFPSFFEKTGPAEKEPIIVGVFGGSVAQSLSPLLCTSLATELSKLPKFKNKPVKVVDLTMGGYKQPQQLLTLIYFLSLGTRFDLVINIDGFNEVALPFVENLPQKLNPYYPRGWYLMLALRQKNYLRKADSTTRKIVELGRKREVLSVIKNLGLLRQSQLIHLVWLVFDRFLERKITQYLLLLQKLRRPEYYNYESSGPTYQYLSDEQFFLDQSLMWQRCSIQMAKICRANGSQYFHFLQPNQYLPGSKTLSPEEIRIAYLPGHPARFPVEKGYPFLKKAGQQLLAEKINFGDLTFIFANTKETVYCDNMCHFNDLGKRLLVQKITETIIQKASEFSQPAEK